MMAADVAGIFGLVRWPQSARVNRVIPKRTLASAASTPTAVRRALTEDVEQLRWLFTLSPALTTLPGTEDVPEFVVIGVELRSADMDAQTLSAIDRAMPRRVILELTRTVDGVRETRMAAVLSARGPRGQGGTFSTPWISANTKRAPLPAAIDLETLYLAVLAPLLPTPHVPGSRVSEVAGTIEAVASLDRKIATLERRMLREVQFNRQVALRQQLRELQRERETLTS